MPMTLYERGQKLEAVLRTHFQHSQALIAPLRWSRCSGPVRQSGSMCSLVQIAGVGSLGKRGQR